MRRLVHCTLLTCLLASRESYSAWNLTPGVTPLSHDIYDLHMTIFWICVVIGMVVFSVMFYAIIHHRKSKNVKPAEFHANRWVEIAWTIIPVLILIGMAIPATKVLSHLRDTSESDITIKITGFQWKWRYEYLANGISFFSNNTTPLDQIHNKVPKDKNYLRTVDHPLVLPIHKKVRFLITSNDVIHSWWVPDLGTKQDAIPGFINEVWTRVNRAGTYHGQCAELCGMNHAYMPIVVVAMAEDDFNKWLLEQKGGEQNLSAPVATLTPPIANGGMTTQPAPVQTLPKPTASSPQTTIKETASSKPSTAPLPKKFTLAEQMQQGAAIFNGTCAVCHQTTGEGMPPTYPALKGSPITTGPLPKHMSRVLFGKPGTAMQAFKDQFSDEELAAVITYERNSWGNNQGDVVQPDQIEAAKARGPLPE